MIFLLVSILLIYLTLTSYSYNVLNTKAKEVVVRVAQLEAGLALYLSLLLSPLLFSFSHGFPFCNISIVIFLRLLGLKCGLLNRSLVIALSLPLPLTTSAPALGALPTSWPGVERERERGAEDDNKVDANILHHAAWRPPSDIGMRFGTCCTHTHNHSYSPRTVSYCHTQFISLSHTHTPPRTCRCG